MTYNLRIIWYCWWLFVDKLISLDISISSYVLTFIPLFRIKPNAWKCLFFLSLTLSLPLSPKNSWHAFFFFLLHNALIKLMWELCLFRFERTLLDFAKKFGRRQKEIAMTYEWWKLEPPRCNSTIKSLRFFV